MANNVVHFDIQADDPARARAFYENVFGWRFVPWGPPGFLLIRTGTADDPGIQGALVGRRAPVTGDGMIGFECTIGVADVEATAAAVEKNGGRIVLAKFTIPTVGYLVQFRDTEGNLVGAIQYTTPDGKPPRFD